MAEKRTLSVRPGLFQKTDEGIPEAPQSSKTAPNSNDVIQKATFNLPTSDVLLLDRLKLLLKEHGVKTDKGKLVSQALHILEQQLTKEYSNS